MARRFWKSAISLPDLGTTMKPRTCPLLTLSKPGSTMAQPRLTTLSLAERVPLMACRGAKPPNLVMIFQCTIYMKGISVNSTPLRECRNQRAHIHKMFKGIAQRSECSMGWFLGFKPYLTCNEKDELQDFMIVPDDVDGNNPLEYNAFIGFACSKSIAGKGHFSKDISQRLPVGGIQFITKPGSNMKGS